MVKKNRLMFDNISLPLETIKSVEKIHNSKTLFALRIRLKDKQIDVNYVTEQARKKDYNRIIKAIDSK